LNVISKIIPAFEEKKALFTDEKRKVSASLTSIDKATSDKCVYFLKELGVSAHDIDENRIRTQTDSRGRVCGTVAFPSPSRNDGAARCPEPSFRTNVDGVIPRTIIYNTHLQPLKLSEICEYLHEHEYDDSIPVFRTNMLTGKVLSILTDADFNSLFPNKYVREGLIDTLNSSMNPRHNTLALILTPHYFGL